MVSSYACFEIFLFRKNCSTNCFQLSVKSFLLFNFSLDLLLCLLTDARFSKIHSLEDRSSKTSQTNPHSLLFAIGFHQWTSLYFLLRKEVIHPHVPVGIPCYDLTPVVGPALDDSLPLRVMPSASGVAGFHGLTGGVYKARERIHRGMLIRDY